MGRVLVGGSPGMDSLIRKLKKWHTMREEYLGLEPQRRKAETKERIEEIKKTKDVAKLLEILRKDGGGGLGLDSFLDQEFRKSVRFNIKERISCIIECMVITGQESEMFRDVLTKHLEGLYSKMERTGISTRLAALVRFQEYDRTDGMKISGFIKDKVDEEIDQYLENVPTGSPRELDRWLNEVVKISGYRPGVVEMYRRLEIDYFLMCIDLVKMNDKETMLEDVAYLIKKIQRRSRSMGTDLTEDVRKKLAGCGILSEDEVEELFENLCVSQKQ